MESMDVDELKGGKRKVKPKGKSSLEGWLNVVANLPKSSRRQLRLHIPGEPIGAPRMTRRDKWAKRPCVVRYMDWRNSLAAVRAQLPPVDKIEMFNWTATFAPPASWSAKKRAAHIDTPHRAKPDLDNIAKALLDGLFQEDKGIHAGTFSKVWGENPGIDIEIVYWE